MKYLISVKNSINEKPTSQQILSNHDSLNVVRTVLRATQSIEETAIDLKTMNLMIKIEPGKPLVLEDVRTGRVMVIQIHNEDRN